MNERGYFVVAFVDLLGTGAKNAEIKAESAFPVEMLEREVARVKTFQRDFYDFFEGEARAEKLLMSQRPTGLRADFERLRGNSIFSYAVSDSLIFYASLNTQQGRRVPVDSCYRLLSALVCAQLWSLARGCPFRGGVEIGRAAVFNGDQILGPALSDAYQLEKQAQFARIIVGDGVRNYLQLSNQLPPDTPENKSNRKFAESCIGLVCESDERVELCDSEERKARDGKTRIFSLDVHSDYVVNLIGEQYQSLLNKAVNFAEGEIQRFSSRDEKLACRYRHLLNYLRGYC